jgi:outer membrane protein assembly factor BamB
LVAIVVLGPAAGAQAPPQPYVDDSTLAIETLSQLGDLLRAGSRAEAARALQRLLDEQADRLHPGAEPSLFVSVRDAVHARLLGDAALLETYAEQQEPEAARLLADGRHREVESTRLLTESGFEAALRVAQEHLEGARFDAAWRTLSRLDRHPLMGDAAHAGAVARLALTIASFAERADLAEQAARWAERAGMDPVGAPRVALPPGLGSGDLDPFSAGAATDLSGVVPSPLHALSLPAASAWSGQSERGVGQRTFWSLPIILDNLILMNDGDVVLALDRFTLRPLWRTAAPETGDADPDLRSAQRLRNRTRLIEDPTTVTAADRFVLAPMGLVLSGRREGDTRLLCLDRVSGAERWAVDPSLLSRDLAGGGLRGPVAVDGETVVGVVRKNERSRRTIGVYLAGLGLHDGSLEWTRLVGSVGALPYQQNTRSPQAPLIHRGAAYLVDEIGLIAAVDAATGRPLWVRRTAGLGDQAGPPLPWAIHRPIPDGEAVVLLSPDRSAVLRLDAETGAILARRSAAEIGFPLYLVEGGDAIAAVGLSTVRRRERGAREPRPSGAVDVAASHGGFTARVAAAGGDLLAPVESGVLVLPREGAPRLVGLDSTGNIAVAAGQVVVVDDSRLRSYLIWDVASAMLRERIEASPDDPEPAVTFAELAHRAGRSDEILPAIDRALAAIDRAGPGASTRAIAARLFEATLEMIESAQRGWGEAEAGGAASVAATALTSALVDRLGRLADGPDQRVAHLLVLGRLQEATDLAAEAVATYQRILTDPILSVTAWHGPRLSVRADLEAERRLHTLIRRSGASVYAPFAEQAEGEFAVAASRGDPGALELVARRFPLSASAARAHLAAARLHRAAGEERLAVRSGARAVETLGRLSSTGIAVDPTLLGRAYGEQVMALARASRLEEAGALAAEAEADHPGIRLLDGDDPIETASLFSEIARRLASRRTLPRLGSEIVLEEEPQLIRGYPLRPLARPEPGGGTRARFDGALFVSPPDGTLSWMAPGETNGPLRAGWTRRVDRDPLLLRIDEVSAWVFWPDESGGWLERIALDTGEAIWVSSPWDTMVFGVPPPDADEPVAARDRFVDPVEGRVRADEVLLTLDARTIALVERGGRAAAVDAASGETLWARTLPLLRVHDVDTAGAVLAVGGVGRDRSGQYGPAVTALDPRTGEVIHTDTAIQSEVRWVRVTGAGDVVAGLNDRVVSVAPAESRLNWELVNPQVSETDDAWLLGDRVLVRALDDDLWLADAHTGRLADAPLDTRGRINTADRVVAEVIGGDLILASSDGVCVFDRDGALLGVDAFNQPATLLPAVVSEDGIALLQIERGRFGLGGTRFLLHLLDHDSARVVGGAAVRLFGEPASIDAVDGRVLIAAGEATLVVRLPLTVTP